MSMKSYYYVGPYLQCYWHFVEQKIEYTGCPKCKKMCCGKYCRECGTEIGKYKTIKKVKSTNFYNYIEIIDNVFIDTGEMSFNGFDVLMINQSYEEREFDIEEVDVQAIQSEMIAKEINWMVKTFSKQIEILNSNYDKIEFKWGIVQSFG